MRSPFLRRPTNLRFSKESLRKKPVSSVNGKRTLWKLWRACSSTTSSHGRLVGSSKTKLTKRESHRWLGEILWRSRRYSQACSVRVSAPTYLRWISVTSVKDVTSLMEKEWHCLLLIELLLLPLWQWKAGSSQKTSQRMLSAVLSSLKS